MTSFDNFDLVTGYGMTVASDDKTLERP